MIAVHLLQYRILPHLGRLTDHRVNYSLFAPRELYGSCENALLAPTGLLQPEEANLCGMWTIGRREVCQPPKRSYFSLCSALDEKFGQYRREKGTKR